ncbi:hypothetical protein KI387_008572, partial [Taxus chinensis]
MLTRKNLRPGAGWRCTAEDVDMEKFAPWRRLEAHNRRCQHGKIRALAQVGGAQQKMSTRKNLRPGA